MRAFLAIALPAPLVAAAAAVARTLAVDPAEWRLPREEGLHLTLRFLGEVDAGVIERLEAAVGAAARAAPVLELAVSGAGAFPGAGRARILWLGIVDRSADGALATLAVRVEEAARSAGLAPETRSFSPHVTIARARAPRARCSGLETVGLLGTFSADEVVLFRSLLGRGGARYEAERRYPLGPAA